MNKLSLWRYLVILASLFLVLILTSFLYASYGYSEEGFTGIGYYVSRVMDIFSFPFQFLCTDINSNGLLIFGYFFNLNFYTGLIYFLVQKGRTSM